MCRRTISAHVAVIVVFADRTVILSKSHFIATPLVGSMHPYGPTSAPTAVHVSSMPAARSVIAPVPPHVPPAATVAPLHPAARALSPAEMAKASPRTATVVPVDSGGVPADTMPPILHKLALANEQTWLAIGSAADTVEDYQRALTAYDSALLHNPYSVAALSAMANVYRALDHLDAAVDCFQRALNIVPENGEIWGAMGHCYLMMDDLQKAYMAYQQALYHLPNPNEPKLWYGIGILYDRYGSLEHAEEAFASVVRMNPSYEKANEIYFRLGIIYKQQGQFQPSLECFRYILGNPPKPLTEMDIHFQIGLVYEQLSEFALAKDVYERVLADTPNHAKILQQLGWLYLQPSTGFMDRVTAVKLLSQSLESDANDPQSWYLLGRAYVSAEDYNEAYEAYQQGLYRDGKNPVLWCSIGILYYQIDQFRDALGAYSRSIRLNPYIPEVWFNLGILYESSNNQINDAIDAYQRALELDPDNEAVQQRIHLLNKSQKSGEALPQPPAPQDVHPSAYSAAAVTSKDAAEGAQREEMHNTTWNREVEEQAKQDARERAMESSYSYEARPYPDVQDADSRSVPPPYGRYEDAGYSRYTPSRYSSHYVSARDRRYELERPYVHSAVMEQRTEPGSDFKAMSPRLEEDWRNSEAYAFGRVPKRSFGTSMRSTDYGRDMPRARSLRPDAYRREELPKEPIRRPMSSNRDIDENYDDSAANSLMGLAGAAASMCEAEERNRESNRGMHASASANPALDSMASAPPPAGPTVRVPGKHVLDGAEVSTSKRVKSKPDGHEAMVSAEPHVSTGLVPITTDVRGSVRDIAPPPGR